LGRAPAVVSCYEAGYDGFWLHRLLLAAGITNYVFDPASIAVDQRARAAKTDRIDGERMLRTLMAYLRGEPRVVRIVRAPCAEQEDARVRRANATGSSRNKPLTPAGSRRCCALRARRSGTHGGATI
jgi:transposase